MINISLAVINAHLELEDEPDKVIFIGVFDNHGDISKAKAEAIHKYKGKLRSFVTSITSVNKTTYKDITKEIK